MIYILDKTGKEFALTQSDIVYLMNFGKKLIGIDENGVFYFSSANSERTYIKYFRVEDKKVEIVGFDYKCKHYRLTDAGVAKEDIARRLF